MRPAALLLVPLLAVACAEPRAADDWRAWYDQGSGLVVEEPIAFSEAPYGFPEGNATGVDEVWRLARGLPGFPGADTGYAPTDPMVPGCRAYTTIDELPIEITGMVTSHPRKYIKVDGCTPDNSEIESEEKYYGSYFIEDDTGGVFVLGDSKVAHFDMGDVVRMRVRAVRDRFDMVTVVAHDILEVDRGPYPIHYEEVVGRPLNPDDIGEVRRITGVVLDDPDTFGEFHIVDDQGIEHAISLDVEINRRGVRYPVGARVQATGPIFFGFNVYTVTIMRVGQVTVLSQE